LKEKEQQRQRQQQQQGSGFLGDAALDDGGLVGGILIFVIGTLMLHGYSSSSSMTLLGAWLWCTSHMVHMQRNSSRNKPLCHLCCFSPAPATSAAAAVALRGCACGCDALILLLQQLLLLLLQMCQLLTRWQIVKGADSVPITLLQNHSWSRSKHAY
jgi:hypothetical protein